jgi:hypothetical protein
MGLVSPTLLSVLLPSLQRLQRSIERDPCDSASLKLRNSILRSIAELDLSKSSRRRRTVLIQIPKPAGASAISTATDAGN